MRYTGPKARRVRRQGMNLYGSDKYDRILQRKPHGPGKEPKASRRGKMSEYGGQLLEKQKACAMYGLNDRQLMRLYAEASRRVGQTDRLMKIALESRLDNAVYRAGFAHTRLQARQFVSHGLFAVNGQRITTPSFTLEAGDKVQALSRAKASAVFPPIVEAHQRYVPPDWMKVDAANLGFDVVSPPSEDSHLEQAIDMRKVIGFYSR